MPPEPVNLNTNQSTFSNINDTFNISWFAKNANDSMLVRSVVSCTDNTNTYNYGTVATLNDYSDDGTQDIGINQFIYDTSNLNPPPFEFILGESRAALQELLEQLKDAGIGGAFFNNIAIVNPIANACEIRLFLFREREGAFIDPSTNGRIYASRSTEITLQYIPPTFATAP